MSNLKVITVRDDDDFVIAVQDPNWLFGLSPRDSEDDEQDHPFAIVGKLLDMREYVAEDELTGTLKEFPITFEAEIVPTTLHESMLESIASCYGDDMDMSDVKEEHRVAFTIERFIGYGGGVPCTPDIIGARLEGTDPFEGLVEDVDYTVTGRTLGFKDWDAACKWVRTHLPNVAGATGSLIGFTMDRPVNAIGTTGWDWIRPAVTGEEAFVF